jgi:hypothetical protein
LHVFFFFFFKEKEEEEKEEAAVIPSFVLVGKVIQKQLGAKANEQTDPQGLDLRGCFA